MKQRDKELSLLEKMTPDELQNAQERYRIMSEYAGIVRLEKILAMGLRSNHGHQRVDTKAEGLQEDSAARVAAGQ